MKTLLLTGITIACSIVLSAQEILPKNFSTAERQQLTQMVGTLPTAPPNSITSPPPFVSLRAMAEWEELQALTIAWTGYPGILKQIVAAAVLETRVIILTEDPQATEDFLTSNNSAGPALSMDNITLLNENFDSIWMRDYAGNPVYANNVDSLMLVDWIYNRPTRPNDDASPAFIAEEIGIPLYTTTEAPTDLVNTGGNFMCDGFGTAFASNLILDENEFNNPYGVTAKSEDDINTILSDYMGISRYIKMPILPYDGIHHIDMHMKIVDEETLLIGEYPDGVADGPQINANTEYVLSNFNSVFGTPYKVVRIPMPDSQSGLYPDSQPTPGYYRTYTNAVFVNKTIIFPTYREEFDTTAFRIWGELCPGYTLVGIDSDNQDEPIISASGAIHCITHSVGVADPLLISHQALPDTYDVVNPYTVTGFFDHRSGIAQAKLFWKTTAQAVYNEVSMIDIGNDNWQAFIPAQDAGTVVEYYLFGESNSGKTQLRPLPAPASHWTFEVLGDVSLDERAASPSFARVFPNPANAITCIELNLSQTVDAQAYLTDISGRKVMDIFKGTLMPSQNKLFLDASQLSSGMYHIQVQTPNGLIRHKLMVK
jgi:agmatine deiminase